MTQRALILGATGQLGSDVVDAFAAADFDVVGVGHAEVDVVDADSVQRVITEARPDVIINTTAFHHLDRCEEEPATAYSVNATGARNVAAAAQDAGSKLIHISTDYVFDGASKTPYQETDLTGALNVYGASKVAGEQLVRATCDRSFVVRTSGLYGPRPCRAKGGLNFPRLMLKLATEKGELTVVTDQVVGPTYTPDLARQLVALAGTDGYGVIHATGLGQVSWHGFATETLRLAGMTDVRIHESTSAGTEPKVKRPAYSILAHTRLEELGILSMRPWQEALSEYIASISRG
jgi:dTDP-4-dehydrorhamnose reductase